MEKLKLKGLLVSTALLVATTAVAQAPVDTPLTDSVSDRVAVLERMVDARNVTQHRVQGQLDAMQQEVSEIRGELEVHSYKLEQILQRQRELYLEIDKRIQAAMITPAPQQVPAASQAPAVAQMPAALPADENLVYERAVNLILKDKRYEQAIPEFQGFLQTYPESTYAPNAHYWLGLLLFNKQLWGESEYHFERVVTGYPDSSKRPDSMLKLGVIAQQQNNKAKALQLYQRVVAEYPNTSVKKLAEARIRNMRQGDQ